MPPGFISTHDNEDFLNLNLPKNINGNFPYFYKFVDRKDERSGIS